MRSLLICTILGIGIGLYLKDKKGETKPYGNAKIVRELESSICKRCSGSGKIATYGYCVAPSLHFHGDCEKDTHEESCAASGVKDCICCNGSGKVN